MKRSQQYIEVVRMTLKIYLKDFRILVTLCFVFMLPIILAYKIPDYLIELVRNSETFHDIIVWPNLIEFIVIFRYLAIFLTFDIISAEYHNSTILPLTVNPISRHRLILGRFFTYCFLLFLIESIAYLILVMITNSGYEFQILNSVIWVGYFSLIMANVITLSISILLSVLIKKPINSLILHLLFIFIAEPIVERFKESEYLSISHNVESIINIFQEDIKNNTFHYSIAIIIPFFPFLIISSGILMLCILSFKFLDIKSN
ncbi:ABC transporter permease [Candidatus Lokiarchaeum ossiferum]